MTVEEPNEMEGSPEVRLGISSCLLGEEVRYNGGHTKDEFLLSNLGKFVRWISACPEAESGMGVPREAVRLVGDSEFPRLIGPRSQTDFTEQMLHWSTLRIAHLKRMNLHGYVLKRDSPSCGLTRVKVYSDDTRSVRSGRGLFADLLTKTFPLMPIEEEGRLRDPRLRENFIERVFIYARWLRLMNTNPGAGKLVSFHTDHKLVLMAHSPKGQAAIGRVVAQSGKRPIGEVLEEYGWAFMEQLSLVATVRKHTNVLQHLMGYLKDRLDAGDKAELLDVIEKYRQGYLPLIVPLTLMRHHLRRSEVPEWVTRQVYLNPYPSELMLRNHV